MASVVAMEGGSHSLGCYLVQPPSRRMVRLNGDEHYLQALQIMKMTTKWRCLTMSSLVTCW